MPIGRRGHMGSAIKVYLLDDVAAMRLVARTVSMPGMTVVGEAGDGEVGIDEIARPPAGRRRARPLDARARRARGRPLIHQRARSARIVVFLRPLGRRWPSPRSLKAARYVTRASRSARRRSRAGSRRMSGQARELRIALAVALFALVVFLRLVMDRGREPPTVVPRRRLAPRARARRGRRRIAGVCGRELGIHAGSPVRRAVRSRGRSSSASSSARSGTRAGRRPRVGERRVADQRRRRPVARAREYALERGAVDEAQARVDETLRPHRRADCGQRVRHRPPRSS